MIFAVIQKGQDVRRVTQRLNINLSTGKQIVQRYRRTGNYSDKRFKANDMLVEEADDDEDSEEEQESEINDH